MAKNNQKVHIDMSLPIKSRTVVIHLRDHSDEIEVPPFTFVHRFAKGDKIFEMEAPECS